ncbi:MAG: M28 family peptidase [Anaerolineae bacterium]
MSTRKCQSLVLLLLIIFLSTAGSLHAAAFGHTFVVDLSSLNPTQRAALLHTPGVAWWVQLGTQALVAGDMPAAALTPPAGPAPIRVADDADASSFVAVRLPPDGLPVLLRSGHTAIAQRARVDAWLAQHPDVVPHVQEIDEVAHHGHQDFHLHPLSPLLLNQILGGPPPFSEAAAPDHSRSDLVAAVSAPRTFADITWLATIQAPATTTRRTGTIGQQLARDWLKAQFESLGYATTLQAFSSPYGTAHNVVAEISGRIRPNDVYIIGGHYDSTSQSAATNAPGAEDNASGTAGVLEMARILARYPPQATVRFIPFAGEEQGLYGSEAYVNSLSASERSRIKGVFIMDMIGYKSAAYPLNVLLESRSSVPGAVGLVTTLSQNAQTYTTLNVTTSYYAWGSDHVPFLDVNLPTVLLIEQEYDSYSCYHRTCDTPDKVTPAQAAEVLKMLIAALDATAGTCLLGDINCDGQVTTTDITMITELWDTGYDRRVDLDHNGHIDIVDVMLAAWQWQA